MYLYIRTEAIDELDAAPITKNNIKLRYGIIGNPRNWGTIPIILPDFFHIGYL